MTDGTNQLAKAPQTVSNTAGAFAPTPENIQLLKDTLSASKVNLTDSELSLFLYQANKTGLDPLSRQIFVIKSDRGRITIMNSIDGQRLVAQRTGEYEGQTAPEWCGKDGKWKDVWLEDGNPAAARVGVYRKGFQAPTIGIATWKSYGKTTGQWVSGGDYMLAKCAEAVALRKAFPQELSNMYTAEEMSQVETDQRPRPKPMSLADAFKAAASKLGELGVSRREDKIAIILGIADIDDVKSLSGSAMRGVLEVIHTEPIEDLKRLYLSDTAEGEVVNAEDQDPDMPPNFLLNDDDEETQITDEELDNIDIPDSLPKRAKAK